MSKIQELQEQVRYLTEKLQRKNEFIERLCIQRDENESRRAASTKSYSKLRKQFEALKNKSK
tara:strand:+ start:43 stop:228 length:186 start_codon:yes stop_codon:yes gene_type:complete